MRIFESGSLDFYFALITSFSAIKSLTPVLRLSWSVLHWDTCLPEFLLTNYPVSDVESSLPDSDGSFVPSWHLCWCGDSGSPDSNANRIPCRNHRCKTWAWRRGSFTVVCSVWAGVAWSPGFFSPVGMDTVDTLRVFCRCVSGDRWVIWPMEPISCISSRFRYHEPNFGVDHFSLIFSLENLTFSMEKFSENLHVSLIRFLHVCVSRRSIGLWQKLNYYGVRILVSFELCPEKLRSIYDILPLN